MTDRWRGALYFAAFMLAFFVLWTLRATVFYRIDAALASPTLKAAYSNMMKLLIWVIPAAIFVRLVKGAEPARYLAVSCVPGWHAWKLCLIATFTYLAVVAVVDMNGAGKSFSPSSLTAMAFPALVGFAFSPLLEEILFRGLVLKELMDLLAFAPANLMTSLLFVGAHVPYWLAHGGLTRSVLADWVGIFIFSLLAGWLRASSASIWPPTVAHLANNLLASVLVMPHP